MTEQFKVEKIRLFIGADDKVTLRRGDSNTKSMSLLYKEKALERRTLDMLVEMRRNCRLEGHELNIMGEWLYQVLLSSSGDEIHNLISDSSVFVRLELEFEDPRSKVACLPWEYLRRPSEPNSKGYFLAAHDQIALTRRPPAECRQFESTRQPKLKIMFVAISPSGLPQLVFDQLVREVKLLKKNGADVSVVATPFYKKGDRPLDTKPKATFEAFKRELKKVSPHVVHFLGHGTYEEGQGKIAFVNDQYLPDWRTGNEVAEILKNVDSVMLAFLQACETATGDSGTPKAQWSDTYQALSSVAGTVVQISKVPAIVAMQARVENFSANTFAQTFYRSLVEHQPIYRAIQIARAESRKAEEAKGSAEHFSCVPVLYLDTLGKNDDGIVFPDPDTGRVVDLGPSSVTCPWCGKVNSGSKQAGIQLVLCQKCRNVLYCPDCTRPINPVDPEDDQIGCNYCPRIIQRVKLHERSKPQTQIDTDLRAADGMRQFTGGASIPGTEAPRVRQGVFESSPSPGRETRDPGIMGN